MVGLSTYGLDPSLQPLMYPQLLRQLLFDDLLAEVDALVADIDARRACNQLLDLLVTLAAKRAFEHVAATADGCQLNVS
jgi:hypothetical protein